MSDPKTLDADAFRFSVEPRIAAPFHDGTTDHVVDAVDGRVVAVFDAHDRAVAVQEVLEAVHDVGVAARHALGQPTDPVPLTRLGDVLRESVAGVLADRDAAHRMVDEAAESASVWRHQSDVEANRAAEMEAQANAEQARADAAERMVAESRAALDRAVEAHANECPYQTHPGKPYTCECDAMTTVRAALANTAEVAGRWTPAPDLRTVVDEALSRAKERSQMWNQIRAERDAAIAARDEAVAKLEEARKEQRFSWEVGAADERARDEAVRDRAATEERLHRFIASAKALTSDRQRQLAAESAGELEKAIARAAAAERTRDEAENELGCIKEAIAQHLPRYANENDEEDELDAVDTIEEAGRELASAIRARDEVGIQLAAAQAEIARMRPVVEAARKICTTWFRGATIKERDQAHVDLDNALARLDAVPGDALAPVAKEDEHVVVALADLNTGRWHKLRVFHVLDEAQAYFDELMAELQAAPQPGVFVKINGTLAPVVRGAPPAHDASIRALIDAATAVDRCYDTGSSIRRPMYALREALDGLRITAALEASGIDASNVKGVG